MTKTENKVSRVQPTKRAVNSAMTVEDAVRIIALDAISRVAEDFTENGWENYPEIGEDDWLLVIQQINELRPRVEPSEYREAYALLEKRAGQESNQ